MYLIDAVIEYNTSGAILHFIDFPGAYSKGKDVHEAFHNAYDEIQSFTKWMDNPIQNNFEIVVPNTYLANPRLNLSKGHSEILIDNDRDLLSKEMFEKWCDLAEYSAECFDTLYNAVKDKSWIMPEEHKDDFYHKELSTAEDIFNHMSDAHKKFLDPTGCKCRILKKDSYKDNRRKCISAIKDLYSNCESLDVTKKGKEEWTLTKVVRKYIWHDRMHAKGLCDYCNKLGMKKKDIPNVYCF